MALSPKTNWLAHWFFWRVFDIQAAISCQSPAVLSEQDWDAMEELKAGIVIEMFQHDSKQYPPVKSIEFPARRAWPPVRCSPFRSSDILRT